MMTSAQLHAELENERAWREEELRFLQNRCKDLTAVDKEKYSRALVLMAYAHVEGFTRFALLGYVRCVNSSGIHCNDAVDSIAAASLSDVFAALRNPEKKSNLFTKVQDDAALHRFARERDFVINSIAVLSRPLTLPDSVVNTENNLWPVVLKKNLFRLGLPHQRFEHLDNSLQMLVTSRNEIGHGATSRPIKWAHYEKLKDAALEIMKDLQSILFTASDLKWYQRTHEAITPSN
jgi:MAE_28990/MAE_18760-like HEPN